MQDRRGLWLNCIPTSVASGNTPADSNRVCATCETRHANSQSVTTSQCTDPVGVSR